MELAIQGNVQSAAAIVADGIRAGYCYAGRNVQADLIDVLYAGGNVSGAVRSETASQDDRRAAAGGRACEIEGIFAAKD